MKPLREVGNAEEKPDNDSYLEYPDDGIETQFTWRSAIIGSLLGCVVASSNMYLGLKIGWIFPAGLFGAILGFAILKAVSTLPRVLGGGPFGMKENCSVQTAATAAGGLSVGFISGIPAMFRLGLMPPLEECWARFYLWTVAAAFYGMCFAVPLRRYYIIKQKLVFPSATAAALTIRSLHTCDNEDSKRQTRWIIWSFLLSTVYKIISYFVPVINNLRILYGLSLAFDYRQLATVDLTWGWKIQITTAFIGAGMMIGMNTSLSFLAGTVLAWGILGPAMMYSPATDVLHDSVSGATAEGVGVRHWNLWIGVTIMVCSSFAELAMQYRSFYNGIKGWSVQSYNLVASLVPCIAPIPYKGADNKDPVSTRELIPTWMWMGGLFASTILTIFVLVAFFEMSVGASILAAVLGFVFSLIGCQTAGEIDINPMGVVGKASQVVFAAIPAPDLRTHQLNNLIAGVLSSSCAAQAVDMVGDLKTGHLLRASPRSQFFAQTVGSCFGVVISVGLFMLFATAYPCILIEPTDGSKCDFPTPAVAAWTGVTKALTTDVSKFIPLSCRIACLVFGLATTITTILKHNLLKNHVKYIPNWNAIGIGFINFTPSIPLASVIGASIALIWARRNPRAWGIIGMALASGLIAGEGIGGVLQALLNIAGIRQNTVATGFGCPDHDPNKC
ncbi:hypothetical protein DSO57_1017734 [Entomophthora muscae]|uniref:Uncharacterized protein n=1 Tax=Entomophthora muscae TaxID=34485 RepID=A0ACC2UDD3_9FUNG|nr:hypothetical protein DSO57_1017734 [Entomophthora muscae]